MYTDHGILCTHNCTQKFVKQINPDKPQANRNEQKTK